MDRGSTESFTIPWPSETLQFLHGRPIGASMSLKLSGPRPVRSEGRFQGKAQLYSGMRSGRHESSGDRRLTLGDERFGTIEDFQDLTTDLTAEFAALIGRRPGSRRRKPAPHLVRETSVCLTAPLILCPS